jgi:hypothetical protein
MLDDLVTLARFSTALEAHEARIELESQGVECVVADEIAASLAFPGVLGVGGVKLQVRAQDAPRAREVLRHTPAARDLVPVEGERPTEADQAAADIARWFLATQARLEAKIEEWADLAGDRLFVDHVTSCSGDHVYALTLSDFDVAREGKRALYVAQPHAHEPGATAGMMDILQQLITGKDLRGRPTALDSEKVMAKSILTFNPIGNPQGREAAPVLYWDGSDFSNDDLRCWMLGEDPENPDSAWRRLDLWDSREQEAPDPVGIVYEQIDEFRFVEPNRSHLSSFFQLFFQMDEMYAYDSWLDLHQAETMEGGCNCQVLLPLPGLATGEILAEDAAWGRQIVAAWQAAGFRPVPQAAPLVTTDEQADYLRSAWGDLHRRLRILTTVVKHNAPDTPPEFQLDAQALAIRTSIERLLA